jgi:hypothetical protein
MVEPDFKKGDIINVEFQGSIAQAVVTDVTSFSRSGMTGIRFNYHIMYTATGKKDILPHAHKSTLDLQETRKRKIKDILT